MALSGTLFSLEISEINNVDEKNIKFGEPVRDFRTIKIIQHRFHTT